MQKIPKKMSCSRMCTKFTKKNKERETLSITVYLLLRAEILNQIVHFHFAGLEEELGF